MGRSNRKRFIWWGIIPMRYRPGKSLAVTSRPTTTAGPIRRCLISLRPMSISSTTKACYWLNSKTSRERPERNEKPTGWKNKISANRRSRGDAKVRVSARSLILGQIRKPFFKTNNRILTLRVPQPKTTHFILRFCLIEKKLDTDVLLSKTQEINKDQTLTRLLDCLRARLEPSDYDEVERAVSTIRTVND